MTTWTEKDSELLVYGWVREPELMSCAIGWKLPARAIAHIEAQAARIRELEARVVELEAVNEPLLAKQLRRMVRAQELQDAIDAWANAEDGLYRHGGMVVDDDGHAAHMDAKAKLRAMCTFPPASETKGVG